MTDTTELPFAQSTQLVLDGLGPAIGDRYRNRNTGTICAVLGLEQHRSCIVTIRVLGEVQALPLANFDRQFERL